MDARRRATVEWDSSESEESDSGSEVSEGHGAAGSESHAVNPGDCLRIYWTGEDVWFRCDVRKVFAGTNDVEVEYVVAGWPLERHCLADMRWEPWSEGDEVDVRECEYDGESYGAGPPHVTGNWGTTCCSQFDSNA